MKKAFSKIISILLAIVFVVATIPVNVVSADTVGALPEGFVSTNIGDANGSASYDSETKTFTVNGSGRALSKDAGVVDSYQFLNYKVEGDVSITAKLVDYDMTNGPYGQAGLVIRADNSTDSADYFAAYVEPSKNAFRYAFRDAATSRVGAAGISGLDATNKDLYIKLEKNGTSFRYSISKDPTFPAESTYTNSQSVSTTATTWYVGMFASSGGNTNSSIAKYSNVKIEGTSGVYFDSEASSEVEPPAPQPPQEEESFLPKGFTSTHLGNTDAIGGGNYDKETKTFTVEGSGGLLEKDTGKTDSYQFINYKLTGDATIVARLVDYDMTNAPYGQAGLVIRADNETTDADYFAAYVEPSKNVFRYAFRDNAIARAGAANIAGLDATAKNLYIKLEKTGNSFKYSISKDASFPADATYSNTQGVTTATDTCYVGMFVSNGGSNKAAVAKFDNVKIQNTSKVYFDSNVEVKPVDTVENLVAKSGDKKVTLSWNPVADAKTYVVKKSTELNGTYTEVATVNHPTTTYVDEAVENFTTYYYKVVAQNELGESNDSLVCIAMPNNSNTENLQYEENAAVFTMTEEPNDTVTTPYVTIKGSTDKDGTITIKQNGVVKVDKEAKKANEEFAATLALKVGRNVVQIYQTTADGKNTLKTYNIVYLKEAYNKIVDSSYTGVDGELVNGIPTYKTISAATASVDTKNKERVTIFVKNGTYKEKTTVMSPYISIIGEDSEKTIWTYDAANGTINPDTGTAYGTSKSASVIINKKAIGFTCENMTIENAFVEKGNNNEQAVALNNEADQSIFVNCRFIGDQDTLLANASSSTPARQYYYNCYIEGDVDFIFGRAQAVFDNCDILSSDRGSTSNNGYVTAANTWDQDKFGYLVINSRLLKDKNMADSTVSLGRPWRPSNATKTVTPQVTYINCYMGSHITSKGWDDMGADSPAATARFSEFASYGPGAKLSTTRPVLTKEEAANYTLENYFAKNSATLDDGTDAYAANWNPNLSTETVNMNTLYGAGQEPEAILPTEVVLDKTAVELEVGATDKLTATVLPIETTDKTIVFASSDETIATVDQEGNITAVKAGQATITATCQGISATCTVTVAEPVVLPVQVVLNKISLELNLGDKEQLTATVLPAETTDKTIVFTSSNEEVATVDQNGNVTAVKAGQAIITATCQGVSASCNVVVKPQVVVNKDFEEELTLKLIKQYQEEVRGSGAPGAQVAAYIGDKLIGVSVVDADGNFSIAIEGQVGGTIITVKMSKEGYNTVQADKNVLKVLGEYTIDRITPNSTAITGKASMSGVYIRAYVDGKQIGSTVKTDANGYFKMSIPRQPLHTDVKIKLSKLGYSTCYKTTTVLNIFARSLTINTIKSTSTTVTGKGQPYAYVRAYVDGVQIGSRAKVAADGTYKITIPKQAAKTIVTVKMSRTGYLSVYEDKKVLEPFTTALTVNKVTPKSTTVTGKGQPYAYVRAYVNGVQIGSRAQIAADGTYKIAIPRQAANKKVTVKMSKLNYATVSKTLTVRY